MYSYFKKKYTFLFNFLFFAITSIIAQNDEDSIRLFSERPPEFLKKGEYPFLNLKIAEVSDTMKRFNMDYNTIFGYCGSLEGAIENLLQTQIASTPHLRFLNKPKNKRYVYFYGDGLYMSAAKSKNDANNPMADMLKGKDTATTHFSEPVIINGREIVMQMLKQHFLFEVQESMDSLDILELSIQERSKLERFVIPFEEIDKYNNGCTGISFGLLPKPNFCLKFQLLALSNIIEKRWNIYTEEKTNTFPIGYFLQFPSDLFDSYQNFYELDAFLREKYGLTIVKKKAWKKIYNIKFYD